MNKFCVVVADSRRARFYGVEAAEETRAKTRLVEQAELDCPDPDAMGQTVTGRPPTETNTNRQAGPVHPIGAQRERHRVEIERRFGHDIARQAAVLTRGWSGGTVVLIADARMLGLVREPLRSALDRAVDVKELARNLAHLTASELHRHLEQNRLIVFPGL